MTEKKGVLKGPTDYMQQAKKSLTLLGTFLGCYRFCVAIERG